MSKSTSVSTGALTADTIVRTASERGMVTYAESLAAAANVYEGTDATGKLLFSLAAGERISFDTPVRFEAGLFVDWNAGGIVVLHIG